MSNKDLEKKRALYREWSQRPEVKKKRKRYWQEWTQNLQPEAKARSYARSVKRTKKKNDKTRDREHHRKPWTEQEIALLWNTAYTMQELAFKLQRTYLAIGNARRRFATRKPSDYYHNGCRKAQLTLSEESKTP